MRSFFTLATLILSACCLAANPSFTVDATRSAGKVSPRLYGLMTEEINHSYDGGLYAELIQNRAFLDDAKSPVNWSVVKDDASAAAIALDPATPLNDKIPMSLRLTVTQATMPDLAERQFPIRRAPPRYPIPAVPETGAPECGPRRTLMT